MATNAAPATKAEPAQMELPADLADVVRMAQSGISDDVIVAYIHQSPAAYSLTADQVVYLRDLGISPAVLQALLGHQAANAETTAESSTPPPTAPTTETNATTEAAPSTTSTVSYYYDSLAPYGTWLYLPAYGWCWQPSVVVINSGWRPYCNDGCWLWTNCGWYWNSYYSWGWAPFHYGRWCQYPRYGWVWCPDRTWGPAWVCWRSSAAYCGWAPLPPGSRYSVGVGWTFNGVSVGLNFGFGLGPASFTYSDYDHFCDRQPDHHFRYGHDADHLFHETRMHDNFVMNVHHHIFNGGIDPHRVEAATHSTLHEVAIREMPHGGGHFTLPDRLERAGNSMVIYRPDPNRPAPRNPFLPSADHRRPVRAEQHNFVTARGYGGEAQNFHGNTPPMQYRSGYGLDHSRQFTALAGRPNGNQQRGVPRPAPVRQVPTHPANPVYQSPRGQSVRPTQRYAPPREMQFFSRRNPYSRESAGPNRTVNSGRPVVRPAPAPTRPQAFVAPRQYSWRPAPAPVVSRPMPSYGGVRGPVFQVGGYSYRGGGGGHYGR